MSFFYRKYCIKLSLILGMSLTGWSLVSFARADEQDSEIQATPATQTSPAEGAAPVEAESPPEEAESAPEIDTDEAEEVTPEPVKPRQGGSTRKVVGKTMEGSRAVVRFEVDTVIRSAYKVNGVPMEVDPD